MKKQVTIDLLIGTWFVLAVVGVLVCAVLGAGYINRADLKKNVEGQQELIDEMSQQIVELHNRVYDLEPHQCP